MLPRHVFAPRHRLKSVPCHWLMTDRRLGAAMPDIVARMPPRSAIVIRPDAMARAGRTALIRQIRRIARAKRHLLLLVGRGRLQGYDGRHLGGGGRLTNRHAHLVTMPVHDRREAHVATKLRVDAVLISPVHETRSHPGAACLGHRGFARLAAGFPGRAVALGGMTGPAFRRLRRHGASGWAAIDAWHDDLKP